jgi:hypothetical protein
MHTILKIMKERVLSASEFKAKRLAYLDEIEPFGGSITIARRGWKAAVLGPARRGTPKSPRNSWARRGRILGDIVSKDASFLWEAAGSK